jgi:hypothetical protein
VSDITIASGGFHDLTTPLTGGTNIDFIGTGGTLNIEPAAFEISTATIGGKTLLTDVSLGGSITGFEPSDTIVVSNLEALYADLDVGPGAAQSNQAFNNFIEVGAASSGFINITPDGSITSTFTTDFLGTPIQYTAAVPQSVNVFVHQLVEQVFGTALAQDTITIQLVPDGRHTDGVFTAASPNPCFAAGTRIATTRGEIAVENLQPGDEACLAEGGAAPIAWIGERALDLTRHPAPHTVRPVRIAAGALGHGVPATALTVSPDHALFLDGLLVQAKDLVDGLLIRQDQSVTHIRYYHVELPQHGILLANGAPAESYLDTGHRGVFTNSDAAVILHPDLMQIRREAESTAPLVTQGPALASIRARLHAHKLMLGYAVCDAPVLALHIGRQLLAPSGSTGGRFTFAMPENTTRAVLASAVFVPAEIDPASNDRRVLGVALSDLWLDGKPVPLENVIAAADLHTRAPGDPNVWTRGAARLTFPPGTQTVTFGAAAFPRIWSNPSQPHARRVA